MSADTSPTSSPQRPAILTEHAKERWIERVCSRQDGVAPWDLRAAFERAISVGAPRQDGKARLHAPTGAVFMFTRDWSAGPDVVVTVLLAARVALNDDHCLRCPRCALRYDPGDGPCPWHDEVSR